MDRESAIHWLHDRFEKVRYTNDADRLADFAIAMAELGAEMSLASLTDAVEAGEIDPDIIDIDEDFGVSVSAIQAMMGSLGMGRSDGEVQSVLAKLKRMQEAESGQRTAGQYEVDEYDDLPDSDIQVSTIRNEQRKVGRNDP